MNFEIHITVNTHYRAKFCTECASIGVKPIVIDTGESNQVMTSSKHVGDEWMTTLKRLSDELIDLGYDVIRKKVEIMPEANRNKDFLYFESHLRLKLPIGFDKSAIKKLCLERNFNMSRNVFKTSDDSEFQMLTLRSEVDLKTFRKEVEDMRNTLDAMGIVCDKVEIEECVYDSNVSLDKLWMRRNFL